LQLSEVFRAGGNRGGLREPDGAFMLMFAEFAFLCIENANNTNKPTNDIDGPIWLEVARIVVGMQELYPHVYKNTTKTAAPTILPLGSGAFHTGPNVRSYGDLLPSNFNDAGVGNIAGLSAASSAGQSSNQRRARVNHKYKNLTFDQLKEAMKENIQQMLRIP